MTYNPFTRKLKEARAKLTRLQQKQERFNQNAMPGTFVTGRSGVSRSRLRKLDRQIDKTIDLAKAVIAAQKKVKELERKEKLFSQGFIDAHGRLIIKRQKEEPIKPRPVSERVKILRKASQDLSIDARHTLPTGHLIQVLVGWDEEAYELIGVIRVTEPDRETVKDYQAESSQGVDLENKWIEVINGLLEEDLKKDS